MKQLKSISILITICFAHGCSDTRLSENEKTSSDKLALLCDPIISDTCCEGTSESACIKPDTNRAYEYGEVVSDYLKFEAKSNGLCTGRESGEYQCASFAKDFYIDRLHHKDNEGFSQAWTPVVDGRYVNRALSVEASYPNRLDPLFVFSASNVGWNGLTELPRETDVLVFENGGTGHFVVTKTPKEVSLIEKYLPIIEQNVAEVANYGPNGSCHYRVLVATKNEADIWDIESGIGSNYKYAGFIRHNLAGIYPDIGWHDDGTSRAFRDAYLAVPTQYPGKSLGWAFDDKGGGPFVHEVRGVTLQNFINTNPDNHFGTDGQTALAMNATGNVRLIKEGFWGAYKCIPGSDGEAMGGAEYLGAPMTGEEYGQIDGSCRCSANTSTPKVMYQLFEGGCLWWRPDEVDAKIHVHLTNGMQVDTAKAEACGMKVENNPPSADCRDDCTPGTQRCLNANQIQICGHPGTDSCYHWLTLSCANGLTCRNNECTTSATVSIATVSSGGSSSGGASSVGGNASTGGSTGAQRCIQSTHRCISNPSVYQICILDMDTGTTDWMSFDCPSGQSCTSNGVCANTVSLSTGGASSVSVSIASVSSSGGRSSGGSSSSGGSAFVGSGGSGSVAGTSSSNLYSTGGAGFVNPISTGGASSTASTIPSVLHLHYEGPVAGRHWIGGWWNALNGRTDITWESSLLACQDQDPGDMSLDCDLAMIPSGVQDFQFQIYLPGGRFWGDESCDPTGGCGATIGTVVLTSGSMTLSYAMKPNQFGAPYYNGWLRVVP